MTSRKISLLCLGVVLMWAFASPAQQAHAQSTRPLPPWQNLTQAQLTAVWWQWVLGIPLSVNPLVDTSGAHAFEEQPYSDLLFLCGTLIVNGLPSGDVEGKVTRSIRVKEGTALFFPLLNTEADNVCGIPHLGENDPSNSDSCLAAQLSTHGLGIPQLRAIAAAQMDSATDLKAKLINPIGSSIDVSHNRLQSPIFSYTLPPAPNNMLDFFGIHNVSGRVSPVVSDGHWSFVPGLMVPGFYTLQFGGSVPFIGNDNNPHTFTEVITYEITVIP